ncbi:MAG: hypothetical protein ACYDEU_07995 [Vulcanimicrobiaceae bacterium]
MPRPTNPSVTVPAVSVSRYMATADPTMLENEGCAQGKQGADALVVLDFGMPAYDATSGQYGSHTFAANNPFASIAAITSAAQSYLGGFSACRVGSEALTLAVGTSNYPGSDNQAQGTVTSQHGAAWAGMIDALVTYVENQGAAAYETVYGADDIEPGWGLAQYARNWVDGYHQNTTAPLVDYGSADNCPTGQGGSCANGWTQDDEYNVAFGSGPSAPMPEIYDTGGIMAAEWYNISLYGYLKYGKAIRFSGPMTQYAACACGNGTNTPQQAYEELYAGLNADSRTAQTPPYLTDITWVN